MPLTWSEISIHIDDIMRERHAELVHTAMRLAWYFSMSADTCSTLVPYFKLADGKRDAVKAIGERFVAKTRSEPGCMHCARSFSGQEVHCREGYGDAATRLAHLGNVGALL